MKEIFKENLCFTEAFWNKADSFGQRTAIETENKTYQYLDLKKSIESLALFFLTNWRSTRKVGICLETSPELVIVLLAVWKSGGVAILLDPKIPDSRLHSILASTEPDFFFMEEFRYLNWDFERSGEMLSSQCFVRKKEWEQDIQSFVSIQSFQLASLQVKRKKIELDCAFQEGIEFPKIQTEDPAYLIFTSGSTGEPKGILLSHEGILPVIEYQKEAFQIKPDSRTLSFLSSGFDAFLSELCTTLLSGACLVIVKGIRDFSEKLFQYIENLSITHAFLPPAILTSFIGKKIPDSLEVVVTGGEVCPNATVREWSKKIRLLNAYGPTETTICSHLALCDVEWSNPILGQILPHRKEKIIYYENQRVGELLLGGVGLAIGYWKNERETQEKFIDIDGERWYKTGDLVSQTDTGELLFLGRNDRQWKIRGIRIEAGEIEFYASQMDGVGQLRLYLWDNPVRLVLGYTGEKEISYFEWKKFLSKFISIDKIPESFIYLKTISLNTNGKWDEEKNRELISQQLLSALSIEWMEDSITVLKNQLLKNEFHQFENSPEYRASISLLKKEHPFQPELSFEPVYTEKSDRVLILGGTGFLGIFFLKEILQYRDVLLLTRNPFAKEKIQTHPVFKGHSDLLKRMNVLLCKPNDPLFGLNRKEYLKLKDIKIVYNLAGSTNAYLSRSALLSSNFNILNHCIQFSWDFPPVQIHHISTLSIFLHSNCKEETITEFTELDENAEIYGGYAQTKALAENSLQSYSEDCVIYRLGLLVGDSKYGMLNQKDFFTFFLKNSSLWINRKTGLDNEMDFLPVDIAASLLCQLSQNPQSNIYHLHGLESLTLRELQAGIRKMHGNTSIPSSVMEQEYVKFLIENLENPDFQNHPLQLFLKTGRKFESRNLPFDSKAFFPSKEKVMQKILDSLFLN